MSEEDNSLEVTADNPFPKWNHFVSKGELIQGFVIAQTGLLRAQQGLLHAKFGNPDGVQESINDLAKCIKDLRSYIVKIGGGVDADA